MEHIGKHIDSPSARSKRERQTERGELMKFFMQKLNPGRVRDGYAPMTLARMGRTLVAIPTRDLYYLKSVCEDAEARGKDFSKKFWWEVKPKPAPTEASGKEEEQKNKNTEYEK